MIYKLVRDKIPDIIKAEGKEPKFVIIHPTNMATSLSVKLKEEVSEVMYALKGRGDVLEELADVVEVVLALAKVNGITPEELEEKRLEKLAERGSFDKRILLEIK